MNTRRNGRGSALVVDALLEGCDGGTEETDGADRLVCSLVALDTAADDVDGTGGSTPISIVDEGTTVLGDSAVVVAAQPVAASATITITMLDEARTRSTVTLDTLEDRGYRRGTPVQRAATRWRHE